MLDYVVNHLDVDNNYLEEFRKGNNEGDAFIIIDRSKYKQLKADKILEKTFRPRPFPLFTGMRKYPLSRSDGEKLKLKDCALEMNRLFEASELKPLAEPLILLLSIFFKIENDQGLTSEDKRIFTQFIDFTQNEGIDTQKFWIDSKIQSKQKIFDPAFIDSMATFLEKLGYERKYAELFLSNSDQIFGKEFYVYTTFSESQADLNPLSYEGFKMIIDDLFHLLSAGSIRMMRMDAIKYLWKEIGEKNFDMDQGNKLIKVIRLTMELTSPSTIPLDEVNSPDPVVYAMTKEGGFAYLFGQVNTVPAAINEGDLSPLIHFNKIRDELSPGNLLAFVMLSTHDGRSVQGLGVQHENGHVTFEQFQNLVKTAESRGGKLKDRSVNPGEIAGETFRKVFMEAGFSSSMEKLYDLFDSDLRVKEDLFKLKDQKMTESSLLDELSSRLGAEVSLLRESPAINYFIQWIIYGKTVYEISSTSRSSFTETDSFGKAISPEEEAQRLALGQLFVLTQGQDVPAIYFNDLLGLENDLKQYEISGKPRDLIRHKNKLNEMVHALENDPFTMTYTRKLNSILKLRAEDNAFYPGSKQFEFYPVNNQIFLNHPWNGGDHSLILGNIVNEEREIVLDTSQLKDFSLNCVKDQLSGETFTIEKGFLNIRMKPFGYLWLK
jgi:glycosidase